MKHLACHALHRPACPPLAPRPGLPLRTLYRGLGLLAALGGTTLAQAQLQTHTDPAAFAAAAGMLKTETFNAFNSNLSASHGSKLVLSDVTVQGAWGIDAAPQGSSIDGSAMLTLNLSYGGWADLVFQQPLYAFGAWFSRAPGTLSVAADSLNGYGSYRNLLQYQPGGGTGLQFIGFTSDQPFNRIVLEGSGCCSLTLAMDNLAYASSVSSVPEPQAWSLLAAGLVGLCWRLRRAQPARPHGHRGAHP